MCDELGMTRQNFYKSRRQRQRREIDESLILSLVHQERALQPRLGARKLLRRLRRELELAGVSIGRDRFLGLLWEHDLLVVCKRRSAGTTDSRHGWRVYENLLKNMTLTGPNQALVSDITYIRTREGFMYLSLVMDAFSRKIVGYDCSDGLEAEGAMRALSMALKQLPSGHNAIHHSDRGCQYCCHEYVGMLERAGVRISMTQENHCYENAQAERLNGILKQEYGLGDTFLFKREVPAAVAQAAWLYNESRPHEALGYEYPSQVMRQRDGAVAEHPRSGRPAGSLRGGCSAKTFERSERM